MFLPALFDGMALDPQRPPRNATAAASSLKACLLENGLAYSPFRDGQSPDTGRYPTVDQIDEDLMFLRQLTGRIRTYSSTNPLGMIPILAEKYGLEVTLGIALGRDRQANDREISTALTLAQAGIVDEVIVGNEVLTGSLLSKAELLTYLRRVRDQVPTTVSVSTAETWDKWSANLDLVRDVDFVVAHFYPFWEKRPAEEAIPYLFERYNELRRQIQAEFANRDVRIVIGETGWPSAGATLADGVVPSPQNQRRFAEAFMANACENSIPFYYFSPFDEEWKWQEGATSRVDPKALPLDRTFSGRWIGSSWGIFRSNGRVKSHFADIFDQPEPRSRIHRDIFVGGKLATYYDIGVDTSHQMRNWLATTDDGGLKLSYPSGQDWGAVFVTVGTPVPMPRPWKDFSEFEVLSIELKGERGGETAELGIKHSSSPDDGSERKLTIRGLEREYRRYDLKLSDFASSRFVVPDDLRRLYVVVEFVFSGRTPQTIYARNIRYLDTD